MGVHEDMKVQDNIWRVVGFTALVLVLWFLVPNHAHASDRWHDRHGYRDRGHHRHHGYHYNPVVVFPGKYLTITIGGERYYHRHGRYYRRHHHGAFVEVANPYPVFVARIPIGCRRIYIGGRTYYTDNVTYYEPVSGGYRRIVRPAAWQQAVEYDNSDEVAIQQPSTDPFTVNIPNNKGGYTAVKLKRSGSGYVGPQGEYYAEFPKVDQLRAMYAK